MAKNTLADDQLRLQILKEIPKGPLTGRPRTDRLKEIHKILTWLTVSRTDLELLEAEVHGEIQRYKDLEKIANAKKGAGRNTKEKV